jgi:hypothetical protein
MIGPVLAQKVISYGALEYGALERSRKYQTPLGGSSLSARKRWPYATRLSLGGKHDIRQDLAMVSQIWCREGKLAARASQLSDTHPAGINQPLSTKNSPNVKPNQLGTREPNLLH